MLNFQLFKSLVCRFSFVVMSSYISNIRNIVGIGRNYAMHVAELGNKLPSKPIVFIKPVSSIIREPQRIELPKDADVHHERSLYWTNYS